MARSRRPRLVALAVAAAAALVTGGVACGGADDPPAAASVPASGAATAPAGARGPGLLVGEVRSIEGAPVALRRLRGGAVLVVNTASRCGYTDQLEGLEALHRARRADGLSVIGFPSDDFRQELEEDEEIAEFCRLRYGVSFPLMAESRVTGTGANPLFAAIAARPGPAGEEPSWNFTKYLLDGEGRLVARFEPSVEPDDPLLVAAVEEVLAESRL
jgi:glutathione peroxidase